MTLKTTCYTREGEGEYVDRVVVEENSRCPGRAWRWSACKGVGEVIVETAVRGGKKLTRESWERVARCPVKA